MRIFVTFFVFLICVPVFAQIDTIVYKPGSEDGVDAWLSDKYPAQNFANYGEISMAIWVGGSTNNIVRSLMDFRLYGLPPGAVILNAQLTLFVFGFPFNWNGSPLSGINDFYIRRITQPWKEDSVTWNNQPAVDTTYQVYVSSTASPVTSRSIDVTNLIIDRYLNPNASFGLMLRMVNETTPFAVAAFASSDNVNQVLHPELRVIYDIGTGRDDVIDLYPEIHIWPNPVQDQLHVRSARGTIQEVNIFDISGRIVLRESLRIPDLEHSLQVDDLKPGTYLVRVRTNDGYHRSRVVKY